MSAKSLRVQVLIHNMTVLWMSLNTVNTELLMIEKLRNISCSHDTSQLDHAYQSFY